MSSGVVCAIIERLYLAQSTHEQSHFFRSIPIYPVTSLLLLYKQGALCGKELLLSSLRQTLA